MVLVIFVTEINQEKENSEFKPIKLRLRNWPCVTSCPDGGVGKYIYQKFFTSLQWEN